MKRGRVQYERPVTRVQRVLASACGCNAPFLKTKPSMTGVTLAIVWPISITSAEPLPAAKLEGVQIEVVTID